MPDCAAEVNETGLIIFRAGFFQTKIQLFFLRIDFLADSNPLHCVRNPVVRTGVLADHFIELVAANDDQPRHLIMDLRAAQAYFLL